MKHAYLLPLLAGSLALACSPQPETSQQSPQGAASQWPNAVHYEIFVQSFADSNGDGIGDLRGLTSKLDYLQDLGIKGVWLMPIHPSPSYHKYDVTDYYGIHPDYGSMDDFKTLLREAHQRDIKIIIDLVINHSGKDHPWFQDAITGPDARYRDYYVWANYDSVASQLARKTVSLDSDNLTQWHEAPGNEQRYYGFFWGGMPDLNFDNPALKEEIFKVGRYWLQEIGVDGFRLDAARHIFPDDRPQDNHAFWVEFRQEMEKAKPDVFLVGEVWTPAHEAAPYLKGLHSLFNFDLGYAITRAVQSGQADSLVEEHQQIMRFYQSVTPDYIDATFLTNHDQNRIISELGGDIAKAKVAASLLLTLPGSPFLYYGEEIGMPGKKPDPNIREPFLWNLPDEDNIRTSWITPEYALDRRVRPLSLQQQDSASLYHHYRRLIHARNSSPVLALGSLRQADTRQAGVVSFVREHKGQQLLVLHNITPQPVSVALSETEKGFGRTQLATADGALLAEGIVNLPPYTSLILE
ncbi:alpha-amylase family glycosyl hydrolase [Cesiribacter andamanensis]|uniref:Alpha-amylase n=1 Tax=Cesiribacter andamanensis AMV16 TaxID=1279009 RepID=M7N3L5_9BACT|nr:alpha-amylase family glycosyl hydrolase [Cesiribacter andamanensis]EMR01887.1 Alpha-amylase precursor [Cesiribacter andamanensis AMV16]